MAEVTCNFWAVPQETLQLLLSPSWSLRPLCYEEAQDEIAHGESGSVIPSHVAARAKTPDMGVWERPSWAIQLQRRCQPLSPLEGKTSRKTTQPSLGSGKINHCFTPVSTEMVSYETAADWYRRNTFQIDSEMGLLLRSVWAFRILINVSGLYHFAFLPTMGKSHCFCQSYQKSVLSNV